MHRWHCITSARAHKLRVLPRGHLTEQRHQSWSRARNSPQVVAVANAWQVRRDDWRRTRRVRRSSIPTSPFGPPLLTTHRVPPRGAVLAAAELQASLCGCGPTRRLQRCRYVGRFPPTWVHCSTTALSYVLCFGEGVRRWKASDMSREILNTWKNFRLLLELGTSGSS
jgi:hypothetical protein